MIILAKNIAMPNENN